MIKFVLFISTFIFFAIAAHWFYSVFQTEQIQTSFSGSFDEVTVSLPRNVDVGLFLIAKENSYFEDVGLSVTFQSEIFEQATIESVIAGVSDFGVSAETPLVHSVLEGNKPLILARIFDGDNTEQIITRRDTGISIFNDLKGKTIGISIGTSAEFIFDQLRFLNGMNIEDITVVDVPPHDLAHVIVDGTVDAVVVSNPILYKIAAELGQNSFLINNDNSVYTYKMYLISNQQYVNSHKLIAKRLLQALVRAETYIDENSTKATQIILRESDTEEELIREYVAQKALRLSLPQSMIVTLEDQTRWAINRSHSTTTAMPNYLDYIYFDALEETHPNVVNIVR